jgi:hypothetical protein
MARRKVFVGVDVAKAQLDVASRPIDQTWQVTNDEAGNANIVKASGSAAAHAGGARSPLAAGVGGSAALAKAGCQW